MTVVRILIPTDGSSLAERALAAMGPWAKSWGAEVVLVRGISPGEARETVAEFHRRAPNAEQRHQLMHGLPIEPPRRLAEDHGQALERIREEAEDHLRTLAHEHLMGVSTEVRIIWTDDVGDAIVTAAKDVGVDFIAMATHGRSGLGKALLGSVATDVVKHATVPVVLVNEHVTVP